MKPLRHLSLAVVIGAVGAGTAEGTAHFLNGSQIEKRSVPGNRIKKNSIGMTELSPGVKKALAKVAKVGATGAVGAAGKDGAAGAAGKDGVDGKTGTQVIQNEVIATTPTTTPLSAARSIVAGDLQGWVLAPQGDNDDPGTNGTVTFDAPSVDSPLGSKALELKTDNGKSVVAYLPLPVGRENPHLSELRVASFASLVKNAPFAGADVSLQFEVLGSTSTKFGNGYTTVVFDPGVQPGTSPAGVWHRHYLVSGTSVFGSVYSSQAATSAHPTECKIDAPCSFDTWVKQNPDAIVQTAKLRIGQNSGAAFAGLDVFVDDARLAFDTTSERYDLGG
jgi:hypothetical protein